MRTKKVLQAASIIATLVGAVIEAVLVAYNASEDLKKLPEEKDNDKEKPQE